MSGGRRATVLDAPPMHLALVGSPNSGKSTLFNALTGLRAKTGNHPGITVSRYQGTVHTADGVLCSTTCPAPTASIRSASTSGSSSRRSSRPRPSRPAASTAHPTASS